MTPYSEGGGGNPFTAFVWRDGGMIRSKDVREMVNVIDSSICPMGLKDQTS